MNKHIRPWQRLLALAIGSMVFAVFAPTIVQAADPPTIQSLSETTTKLQISIDTTWVLITGFLVFFMQTGFAMLEAGLIRQRGVVNALLENFIDAAVTILVWWGIGFGIAFGTSAGGLVGIDTFFLSQLPGADGSYPLGAPGSTAAINTYALFFFQFAFAATASTITTGSMAGRTDFVGDLIYSAIMGAISYPLIVHWVWNSGGWLAKLSYHDFAGSSVVHSVGGWTALVGAYLLGPRPGRPAWGTLPPAHNLGLATLGTMILWFGWYGFNPGSTLSTGNTGLIGLVTVNTTLAAGAAALSAIIFQYTRTGKWDLVYCLNGSLAGLVAITAPCAYVAPWASVLIGLTGGILVTLGVDLIESLHIDDPVGAFAVHGMNGMMGTLSVGFLGQAELTLNKKAGLFLGGGFDLLGIQLLGVVAIAVFTVAFSFLMFSGLKALGRLRVDPEADRIGIDAYEHGASVWPDVYAIEQFIEEEDKNRINTPGVSPIDRK
ncbi:MAG: ammonium transporter [Nostoc sp. NMS1]|uniref:ammonium transporter n=1 Tax=unclassified Nostoc TaxID=2593658 RepID=UPI0025EFC87A|nr:MULTISPECIES: ammonium transporter [unclassified Nostoc]MBN3909509.1 ammonium transporter [Nostoc sp. NMS1]MBN3994097.1 ammonium transporter [Nostoc sp. NMS2]